MYIAAVYLGVYQVLHVLNIWALTSDKDRFVVHSISARTFDRQTVKEISHNVTDKQTTEDCAA